MDNNSFNVDPLIKEYSAKWPEKAESIERLLNSLDGKLDEKLLKEYCENIREAIETKNEFQFQLSVNLARRMIQTQEDLQPVVDDQPSKTKNFNTAILVFSGALALGLIYFIFF